MWGELFGIWGFTGILLIFAMQEIIHREIDEYYKMYETFLLDLAHNKMPINDVITRPAYMIFHVLMSLGFACQLCSLCM